MKHAWVIFALLLLSGLTLFATFWVPESDIARGIPHSDVRFKGMKEGGDGGDRHGPILYEGWIFAVFQLALFASLLAFAMRNQRRVPWNWLFFLGVGFEIAGISSVFLTYQQFLREIESDAPVTFLGPFPAPTTLMILSVWALPWYYVFLYGIWFSREVWSRESADKFQQLLIEKELKRESPG